MGCRTGFYLLTRGLTPAQALALTVDSFPRCQRGGMRQLPRYGTLSRHGAGSTDR